MIDLLEKMALVVVLGMIELHVATVKGGGTVDDIAFLVVFDGVLLIGILSHFRRNPVDAHGQSVVVVEVIHVVGVIALVDRDLFHVAVVVVG